MEATKNTEAYPDIFGPYFPGMEKIHSDLFELLRNSVGAKQETVMSVLQCNFREYVEKDHDKNYEWKKLCFGKNSDRHFAIGINKLRLFHQKDRQESVISKLLISWENAGFERPEVLNAIQEVRDLAKDNGEMILSVHFWFDARYNDDEIPDTQYCKVVYTYSSLWEYLERIRNL